MKNKALYGPGPGCIGGPERVGGPSAHSLFTSALLHLSPAACEGSGSAELAGRYATRGALCYDRAPLPGTHYRCVRYGAGYFSRR